MWLASLATASGLRPEAWTLFFGMEVWVVDTSIVTLKAVVMVTSGRSDHYEPDDSPGLFPVTVWMRNR